jgi:hypothetical protein
VNKIIALFKRLASKYEIKNHSHYIRIQRKPIPTPVFYEYDTWTSTWKPMEDTDRKP